MVVLLLRVGVVVSYHHCCRDHQVIKLQLPLSIPIWTLPILINLRLRRRAQWLQLPLSILIWTLPILINLRLRRRAKWHRT